MPAKDFYLQMDSLKEQFAGFDLYLKKQHEKIFDDSIQGILNLLKIKVKENLVKSMAINNEIDFLRQLLINK